MNLKHLLTIPVLLFFFTFPVLAQKAPTPSPTPIQSGSTPTPAKKVEYILPYPGILPDHPLFVLKRLRDWIIEVLIADPVRKAEFYILQADKRLGMGRTFKEQGKAILATKAFSEASLFRTKAINNLAAVKAGGRELPGYVLERLGLSLAKHSEVLLELGLAQEAEDLKKLEQQFTQLK